MESAPPREGRGRGGRIEAACGIADAALAAVAPMLEDGPTERGVRARPSTPRCAARAPTTSSFETIVAAGPNGSRPTTPVGSRIQRGDLVVIDFGALVDGYHSDMTRTIPVGGPEPSTRPRPAWSRSWRRPRPPAWPPVRAGRGGQGRRRGLPLRDRRGGLGRRVRARHRPRRGPRHPRGAEGVDGGRRYARRRPCRHRRTGRLPPRARRGPHRGHGRGHRIDGAAR